MNNPNDGADGKPLKRRIRGGCDLWAKDKVLTPAAQKFLMNVHLVTFYEDDMLPFRLRSLRILHCALVYSLSLLSWYRAYKGAGDFALEL